MSNNKEKTATSNKRKYLSGKNEYDSHVNMVNALLIMAKLNAIIPFILSCCPQWQPERNIAIIMPYDLNKEIA